MDPTSRQTDEHGFPVPVQFDQGSADKPKRRWMSWKSWRLFFAVLLFGIILVFLMQTRLGDIGRQVVGQALFSKAQQKHLEDDLEGAVADLNRAMEWLPDEPKLLEFRALLQLETQDLNGSLRDYDRLIEIAPQYGPAYLGRGVVLQRLGEHRRAIDDLTRAVQLHPDSDSYPLNSRAYARAIAGIELQEALRDVDRALELLRLQHNDIASPQYTTSLAAYLDTRGYLLHLLNRNDEALKDLDEAIELASQRHEQIVAQGDEGGETSAKLRARRLKASQENMSVMYHHRGLVHQKLGNASQAADDLERGDSLGYDPQRGVY